MEYYLKVYQVILNDNNTIKINATGTGFRWLMSEG